MFVTKRYKKRSLRYDTVVSDDNDNCPRDNLCFGCRRLMAEMKACPCHHKKTAQQQNQGMVRKGLFLEHKVYLHLRHSLTYRGTAKTIKRK